ncbi:MAG: hypothetical protein QW470_07510 [Candidatus Caldarchaeum sp.]
MRLILLVPTVIVIIVGAVGLYFVTLQRPQVRTITVTATDFKYSVDGGEAQITLNAGEEVRVIFENRGKYDHEFLLVKDKDQVINAVKEKLEAGASDAELDKLKAEMAYMGIRFESEPGGTSIFRLRLTERGTYYFLCLETEPEEEPHAEHGEIGVIVVQ